MRRARLGSCPALLALSLASELGPDHCSVRGNHGSIGPFSPRSVRARRANAAGEDGVVSSATCILAGK